MTTVHVCTTLAVRAERERGEEVGHQRDGGGHALAIARSAIA